MREHLTKTEYKQQCPVVVRYKLFWMGGEEKLDGVGIFVAEEWVDSVVIVERHSKRVLSLKMVLDDGFYTFLRFMHCTQETGGGKREFLE